MTETLCTANHWTFAFTSTLHFSLNFNITLLLVWHKHKHRSFLAICPKPPWLWVSSYSDQWLKSGAANSDPDTLQRPTVHLLPQISIGATCLCVSPDMGAVWWPRPPSPPSVKSPRGPDHSEVNMWFELASQKQALHTWGCQLSPTAHWSNTECVLIVFVCVRACMNVYQFLCKEESFCVSVWRGFKHFVCVCVCSSNPTAGNKGQLRSQHIVSLEAQRKNKRENIKKNLLNFALLVSIVLIFILLPPSLSNNIFLFILHIRSNTAAIVCLCFALCLSAGCALQQPGGGFGFRQRLSLQHLRKQSSRETNQLVPAIFSLLDYLINFSLRHMWFFFSSLFQICPNYLLTISASKRPLWFVTAWIRISPLIKSFSDRTERCLFNLNLNWSRLNIITLE